MYTTRGRNVKRKKRKFGDFVDYLNIDSIVFLGWSLKERNTVQSKVEI